MADCFSLQSIKEYVEDLRAIEAYGEMFVSPCEAGNYADAIEQLMQKVAEDDTVIALIRKKAEDEIEHLIAENGKLKAERDAAVAAVEELNDDFVECVCSGYGNLSPYCGNRCAECVDKRGWCKEVTKYCRGFIPMSYKDWRGVQKEEEE